jgi:hypothetical protein
LNSGLLSIWFPLSWYPPVQTVRHPGTILALTTLCKLGA